MNTRCVLTGPSLMLSALSGAVSGMEAPESLRCLLINEVFFSWQCVYIHIILGEPDVLINVQRSQTHEGKDVLNSNTCDVFNLLSSKDSKVKSWGPVGSSTSGGGRCGYLAEERHEPGLVFLVMTMCVHRTLHACRCICVPLSNAALKPFHSVLVL